MIVFCEFTEVTCFLHSCGSCGSLSFCLAGYVSFIICAKQNHGTPSVAGGASLGCTLIDRRVYLSVMFLCGEWNGCGTMHCSFLDLLFIVSFFLCSFCSCRHCFVLFIFFCSGMFSVGFELCAYVTPHVRMFVLFLSHARVLTMPKPPMYHNHAVDDDCSGMFPCNV